MECWLKIQSEISIGFVDNEAFWNTMRRGKKGIAKFEVSIHDHCIHHIEDERIIDVLYRDHDYTVSNFNDVWGLSEQDYEIGELERELDNRCWNHQGKIFACLLPFS